MVLNLNIANARIGYRNFAGNPGQYNPNGDRSFNVFFDDLGLAEELRAEGWHVKDPKPREGLNPDEDTRLPRMEVMVSYKYNPPKVVVINGDVQNVLDEDEVGMLDFADIENVDLVIRPYNWEMNGRTGIKAYLKAIYVTVPTDEFVQKYGI